MADQNAKTEMINQFKDLTGVPEDRAKFYLESAAWNVEVNIPLVFIQYLPFWSF